MCRRISKFLTAVLIIASLVLCLCADPVRAMDAAAADNLAQALLMQSGRHCAMIAVPHCGSGELAVSFWNQGGDARLIVDAFESDPTLLASAQQKASALGLLGRNLYVRSGTLSTNAYSLPYADHFVDLVALTSLADADLNNLSYAEFERVLSTGASAWIGRAAVEGAGLSAAALTNWINAAGARTYSSATVVSDTTGTWAVITKISRLPDTYEGNGGAGGALTAAGGRFYNDKVATWPTLPQWYVKPYGRINADAFKKTSFGSFSYPCVGGGHIYGSTGSGLSALRAYNGQLLWNNWRFSSYGAQPFSKGIVCGTNIIDGETGVAYTNTIPLPGGSAIWSAVDHDVLYSATPNTLFAYNLTNCTVVFSKNYSISGIVTAGGNIYAYYGTAVYCYNTLDGSVKWGPVTAPEAITKLHASPNGVLLQAGSGTVNLYFLAAADGAMVWGPKAAPFGSYIEIMQSATTNGLHNGREFVCGINCAYLPIDLLTGSSFVAGIDYGSGSCPPGASSSPAGTFSRRGGMEYSLAGGGGAVPGGAPYASACGDSPFAASGMTIYKTTCGCYGLFRGTKAEASMSAFNPEQTAVEAERLERGLTYTNLTARVVPDAKDWPTHRANNNRSGASPAKIATDSCVQLWKYTNPTPNVYDKNVNDSFYTYQDITPPVTAGGYTYIAGSDGIVKCFQNASGSNIWNYATGGWIFATPTLANGCVYVGSGDGYAYCIEAHTGKLVWRFRGAPAERRFNYFGHLLSPWPILTGVLVHTNGLAYFVSGMVETYGVQAYAVDARTGSLTNGWQNTCAGVYLDNRPGLSRKGLMPGGYMTIIGSNLWVKETIHGYFKGYDVNKQHGAGVFNLQTGVIASNNMVYTWVAAQGDYAWTGRQIAKMGNYMVGWGEDIHTEMEFEQYGGGVSFTQTDASGKPVYPCLMLPIARVPCFAWDDADLYIDHNKYSQITTKQYYDATISNLSSYAYPVCYTNALPSPTTDPLWRSASAGGTNRATALTANCLIEVNSGGNIGVMDRVTGSRIFQLSSGGEPYLNSMAIDRSGKIIVANRNGDVVCYGTTNLVIVTPPSDVSGVDPGQAAAFSVEALAGITGGPLTYQWYHNGAQISNATNATYTISAVTPVDAGAYYAVVTGSGGSATSSAAALALSVSASIKTPVSGAAFVAPASITINATATSTHGTITNVVFCQGATMIGSAISAPYSMVWSNVAGGSYSLTAVAFDDQGKTGVSKPVNVTVAGLVAHLTFDESSGTVAHDTSGQTNNGTLINGASWTAQSLFNGGVHFNGPDTRGGTNAVNLGASVLTNAGFTLGFWLNSDLPAVPYGNAVISFKDSGTNHSKICSLGGCELIWSTTTGSTVPSVTHSPAQGTWYHYAIVAAPSKVDWYVNGSIYASLTPPSGQTMMTSYTNFIIGNAVGWVYNAWPSGFQGTMDELKIYDRALGASEVMNLYTNARYARVPPTISISTPTNLAVISSTNCVTLTANTIVSNYPAHVIYYHDGTLMGTSWSSPYALTWSNVPRGTYSITAVAVDGLNLSATSTPVQVQLAPLALPTISLAGGTYATAQTVTFCCADSNASIYYTIDGSDPLPGNGTLYVPGYNIPVNQTMVFRVRAFENGMYPSESRTIIYRIGGMLASGNYHSTVLRPDGATWAWGSNGSGQLGDGTAYNRSFPVFLASLSRAVCISGGASHGLALMSDGTVWGWGNNGYGQLGDGSSSQRNAPVQSSGLTTVSSVSAGGYHSLALRGDGTVWAWGYNAQGQLGDGTITTRTTPVQVSGLSNVVALAGGSSHSLALKNDGTVWAWGYNALGQLGNNTNANTNLPVQVTGLSNVVALAGGGNHSLAVKNDGTVWAWGYNAYGQLGDGTITTRTTAVQVNGLSNVVALAGGGNHSLAVKNDGTVWAWGNNAQGQLGNNTTANTNVPVQVSGLDNVAALAGGAYHSLALKNDSTVWAWGYNYYGQLGNSTNASTNLPVSVSETIQFITTNQTVTESSGIATIGARLFVATNQDVIVPFTLAGSTAGLGTNYSAITASPLVITAGQVSTNITVSLINDSVYRGTPTIQVNMLPPTNALPGSIKTNLLTILDDDPMSVVQFTASSQSVVENISTVQIGIQLSAPCGIAVSVPFTLAGTAVQNTDYVISASPLTIPAGINTTNLSITVSNRPNWQGDRTVIVKLGAPTNATIGSLTNYTLTITDKDPVPVAITNQPLDQAINWGQAAAFSVTAIGTAPLYQWRKGGSNISGATNASYVAPPAVVADNGAMFSVVVSNAANSVTSRIANLTVQCNPPPMVSITQPANAAQLTPPADLMIYANANAFGGGSWIQKVDYYNNGSQWLGEVITLFANPYILALNSVRSGTYNLTAVVTDNQGQTATSSVVQVTVGGAYQPALNILTASELATGTVGFAYTQSLTASGGTPGYMWSVISNGLPAGLGLVASSGAITGTPLSVCATSFTARVTDAAGSNVCRVFSLSVISAYRQWCVQQFGTTNAPAGDLLAKPANDGIGNLVKYALGIDPRTPGYQNHFTCGITNLGGQDHFALTYIRPDPAPLGVSYAFDAADDLRANAWTNATITVNTNINGDGTVTITVHDNASSSLSRYLRLLVIGNP